MIIYAHPTKLGFKEIVLKPLSEKFFSVDMVFEDETITEEFSRKPTTLVVGMKAYLDPK